MCNKSRTSKVLSILDSRGVVVYPVRVAPVSPPAPPHSLKERDKKIFFCEKKYFTGVPRGPRGPQFFKLKQKKIYFVLGVPKVI